LSTQDQITYFVVFIVGQGSVHLLAHKNTSLKSPSSSDVAHRVATSTENKSREIKALDIVDTVGVTVHTQIEATESIARQTVTTALENNSLGLVVLHDILNDRLEDGLVGHIGDTISKRKVDSIVFSLSNTSVSKFTSAGEVLSVLVERNRHDTVGGVESLLDTITMMHVNIDVKDPLFESKEFENTEDNV
jgi:hypothetical protein